MGLSATTRGRAHVTRLPCVSYHSRHPGWAPFVVIITTRGSPATRTVTCWSAFKENTPVITHIPKTSERRSCCPSPSAPTSSWSLRHVTPPCLPFLWLQTLISDLPISALDEWNNCPKGHPDTLSPDPPSILKSEGYPQTLVTTFLWFIQHLVSHWEDKVPSPKFSSWCFTIWSTSRLLVRLRHPNSS